MGRVALRAGPEFERFTLALRTVELCQAIPEAF